VEQIIVLIVEVIVHGFLEVVQIIAEFAINI
jgi:hypothetical protein